MYTDRDTRARDQSVVESGVTESGFVLFFEFFKFLDFPWLFPCPFLLFDDHRFSCHFLKLWKLLVTCFSIFLALKQFNRSKLWYPPKCVLFALFNYSSLSYVILALSSAVTNLPHKGENFNFPWLSRTDNFKNSMTFQFFHDLYEPWEGGEDKTSCKWTQQHSQAEKQLFSKLRYSPVSEGKRCRKNKESTLWIIHSAVLIIEFVFL